MKWHNKSLRRRLAFWLIMPLGAVSALMLMEVRSSARNAANQAYDRVLLGSALAIAERVVVEGNEILVDVPYVALEMLTSAAQDRVFYSVSGPDNKFITGYADLPPIPAGLARQSDQPVFYDDHYKGADIRVGAVSSYVSSPRLSARVTIKVAETIEAREALIDEMLASAALRQGLLIAIAGLIFWIGLGWGLRPLINLEQAINRRNPKDLRPILHEVPYEARNLVGSINHLMARLGSSIDAMQRFTANAAHQLRTPLAAIQAQAELAQGETDPQEMQKTLAHLRQSTIQTSRLVNQLLSLARATPDASNGVSDVIDLNGLCIETTQLMVPDALAKDIDLGMDSPAGALTVLGDNGLIEELLRNLIHNALSYCPAGSHVTVRLYGEYPWVILEVEDNGPGILQADRKRVFERFYRIPGSANTSGCGLGLPIVREIIRRHGGDAVILTGANDRGARVRVTFPAAG
ncbi:MAG: sensor histidine kinase [Rhodospirillales bacterium]|nr:sensor histidine kinase [Rhodospirillales bacterium]